MLPILKLFATLSNHLVVLFILFVLWAAIKARFDKKINNKDAMLLEMFIYFTTIAQSVAIYLSYILHKHNVIVSRIYFPVQIILFTYFLTKWAKFKHPNIFIVAAVIITILSDLIFGDQNFSPDFMIWSDAIILIIFSLYLSIKADHQRFRLKEYQNYFHIGIYIYAILTLIGISPSTNDIRIYGFIIQNIGSILLYFYFIRGFRCLYQLNG